MRIVGKVTNLTEDTLTLEVNSGLLDSDLIGQCVTAEIKKYKEKRSLSANAYFWAMVSDIAYRLNVGRTDIYKWLIREAGVSRLFSVKEEALPEFAKLFSFYEVLNEYEGTLEIMAFFGTSTYDTKQMSRIIEYTHQQALDIGCETWTDEEIRSLLEGINEKN